MKFLILALALVAPAFAQSTAIATTTVDSHNGNAPTRRGNGNNGNNGNNHNTTSKSASTSAAASDATNSGNNTAFNETYKQVRQTPFAYAPDALPTAPCIKGYSVGGSSPILAGTFGSGKVDKGCDARETARQFALLGNRQAAAKILCSTDAAKRAKLTLDDCLASTPEPVTQARAPEPPSLPTITILPAPVTIVSPPVAPVVPSVVPPATLTATVSSCKRTVVRPRKKNVSAPCLSSSTK